MYSNSMKQVCRTCLMIFFFIWPKHSHKCLHYLNQFVFVCKDIGIPIKVEKTQLPTTVITIYGIEVDSNAMIGRLLDQKLVKSCKR